MGRRRLVVLLSAIVMMLIGAGLVGGLVVATQSDGGREWIRAHLVQLAARGVKGRLYVGKLSGSLLTDFAVDSVALIGPDDSVFIATGPVHITYDPRDLIDGRFIVRSVELQHPFFVIRKENNNVWNYDKVFPPGKKQPAAPPPSRSAFGAIVQFRNVRIRDLGFQLTLPWSPDDSLKGARRDSAIVKNLAAKDQEIHAVTVNGKRGYQRTTRWTEGNFTFNRIRLRDPLRPGRQFTIARFDVNEHSPPFAVRNMIGNVLWRGDSIVVDIRHLELPGSVASATGHLYWSDTHPVSFDLRIASDSVSLNDVAWITSVIPKTGGGSMRLQIKSERGKPLLDYIITKMDLRTNASHLTGAMTFAIGGPVLIVKDLNVNAAPFDFALIKTMSGGPLAQPWNGAFTGTARATGGPVNHFMIDALDLTYTDKNVPGATTAFKGSGEVDILSIPNTTFHGFHLDMSRFDLRTPQFLSPGFPRLNGVISGTATLDSIWTDVRFRDADIMHRDGDSTPPSHLKGDARLTTGATNVSFDVSMAALPLSLTTFALSYPNPLRGEWSGPVHLQGDAADFNATADLTSDAGRLQLEGQFDLSAPGYRAFTRGSVTGLDLSRVLARANTPSTNLNGRFVTSLEFDSLPNMLGDAQLTVDRSAIDQIRLYSAQANLRFAGGDMTVDTLRVEMATGTVTAHGGLGLAANRVDSLLFRMDIDSLGGLRRYLVKARVAVDSLVRTDTAAAAANALADSLSGSFNANGVVAGNISKFSVRAAGNGTQVRIGALTARQVAATASIKSLPDSSVGALTFAIDTLRAAGLAFSRVSARDTLLGSGLQRITVSAKSPLDSARAVANIRTAGDTTQVRIDSVFVQTSTDAWLLGRRALIESGQRSAVAVDSVLLASKSGGLIAMSGKSAADSAMNFSIRTDSVPLADIGELMQTPTPLEGTLTVRTDITGTRDNPVLKFDTDLRHGLMLGLRIDELHATGDYANRSLSTAFTYSRLGIPALHGDAKLPIDLGFNSAGPRLIESPLTANIHTDSAGVAVIASLSQAVTKAGGAMTFDAALTGTWKHPLINGALTMHNGELSLEQLGSAHMTGVEANIVFKDDSIGGTVSAKSGVTKPATGELSGYVSIRDIERPAYNLKLVMQNFNVIDKARFATLDLTGNVSLTGASDDATLTGALTVDRGSISIPDLATKHVISLDDPEFYRIVDTTAFEDRHLLPAPPASIISHLTVNQLRVQMGRDVWLKSSEANINLGGDVTIQQSGVSQRGKTKRDACSSRSTARSRPCAARIVSTSHPACHARSRWRTETCVSSATRISMAR